MVKRVPSAGGYLPLGLLIFGLMLPVTGVVPVLDELTRGRHPGLSDFAQHLFMVANMLAAVLFAPLVGQLSDRIGRRQPVLIGSLLANIVVLLLLARDAPYAVHLLLRFFDGALHISALTLLMTMAGDRGSGTSSGRAMGTAGLALTLGVAAGAPLGGWLGGIRPTLVLEAGAVLSLLLAVGCCFLNELPASQPSQPEDSGQTTLGRLPWRQLVVPYAFTFADRLSVGFIVSTMTLYMRRVLDAEPERIGLLMASFMLPFALLSYPFARLAQAWGALTPLMAGSLLYAGALVALSLAPLPLWFALMPAGGIAAALMFAPTLVLTAAAANDSQRARAMGGFHAAGSLGFLLGPLVGGGVLAAAELFGRDGWLAAFWLVAGLQLLCVALFLPLWLRRRGSGG